MEETSNRTDNVNLDSREEKSFMEEVDRVKKEYTSKVQAEKFKLNKYERSQDCKALPSENSTSWKHDNVQVTLSNFSGEPVGANAKQQLSKVLQAPLSSRQVKLVFNLNPACHLPSHVPHTCTQTNSAGNGIMSTCTIGNSSVQMSTASSKHLVPSYSNLGKIPSILTSSVSSVEETDLKEKQVADTKKNQSGTASTLSVTHATSSKCVTNGDVCIQQRSDDLTTYYSERTNENNNNNATQEEYPGKIIGEQDKTIINLKTSKSSSEKDLPVRTSNSSVNLQSNTAPFNCKTINATSSSISSPVSHGGDSNILQGVNMLPISPPGMLPVSQEVNGNFLQGINMLPISPPCSLQQSPNSNLSKTLGSIGLIPANFFCSVIPNTTGQGKPVFSSSGTSNTNGNQTVKNLGNPITIRPTCYIVVNNNLQGMLNLQSSTTNTSSTSASACSSSTTFGLISTNACPLPLQQLLSSTASSQSAATRTLAASGTAIPNNDTSVKNVSTPQAQATNILTLQQLFATPPANAMIWTLPVSALANSAVSNANKSEEDGQGQTPGSESSEGQIIHPLLKTPPKKIRIEPLKPKNSKKKLKEIKPKIVKPKPTNMKSQQPNGGMKMPDSVPIIKTISTGLDIPVKIDEIGEMKNDVVPATVATVAHEKSVQNQKTGIESTVQKLPKFFQVWISSSYEEHLPAISKKKVKENVAGVPKEDKKRLKRQRITKSDKDLVGDASSPKRVAVSEDVVSVQTPPSVRDKKKQAGLSSGTKRKLKKKLQSSSKVKKQRVENEMSKYISVLKVRSRSAAQGDALKGMLNRSGPSGFSVSKEPNVQCIKRANSAATGAPGHQQKSAKAPVNKTDNRSAMKKSVTQCIEAGSDIDLNNNVSVRFESSARSEPTKPTSKSHSNKAIEKADNKGPVLLSFLQDGQQSDRSSQSSADKNTQSNPEEVHSAMLQHIEKEIRILEDLPQSFTMKAPAPSPLPLPSMWTYRYDILMEKSCYGRLILVVKDAQLNLKQTLMGDKIAAERLKRKLIYAESLVKKYRDYLDIQLHAIGDY